MDERYCTSHQRFEDVSEWKYMLTVRRRPRPLDTEIKTQAVCRPAVTAGRKQQMSFTTKADAQQRAANEQFEQQCRVGLDAIYVKYPVLVRTIATDKLIIELVSQYMGE